MYTKLLIINFNIMIVAISIYLFSIGACRWGYRKMSSRGIDHWRDEDCTISFMWFLPLVNTLTAFILSLIFLSHTNFKSPKNKIIRKLTNHDITV